MNTYELAKKLYELFSWTSPYKKFEQILPERCQYYLQIAESILAIKEIRVKGDRDND